MREPRTATRNARPPITPPAIAPAWEEVEGEMAATAVDVDEEVLVREPEVAAGVEDPAADEEEDEDEEEPVPSKHEVSVPLKMKKLEDATRVSMEETYAWRMYHPCVTFVFSHVQVSVAASKSCASTVLIVGRLVLDTEAVVVCVG